MQTSNVSLAIRISDWSKWLEENTTKYVNEEISSEIYHFFLMADVTIGEEYMKLDWLGVNWSDTSEEVEYILNWLEEIKHYDLVRIVDDEVFADLHTGKNILKIKHYVCFNDSWKKGNSYETEKH